MSSAAFFAAASVAVFCMGLYGLFTYAHLLRKIMTLNIMASAVFLLMGSLSRLGGGAAADAVPQAMVITGIVVAVAVTALAVGLARRIWAMTGQSRLPEEREEA